MKFNSVLITSLMFTIFFTLKAYGGSTDPFVTKWSDFKFSHPGISSTANDLKNIRNLINVPGTLQATQFADLTKKGPPKSYTPHPSAHPCSEAEGNSGIGCDAMTWYYQNNDANAAYQFALEGALSGDLAYTHLAETILDAWATGNGNPKNAFQGDTGLCWYLCDAWIARFWADTAELVRESDPAWAGKSTFGEMLNRTMLPVLHVVTAYGNRDFAVISALMAIGVFNDDPAAFAEGLTDLNNSIKPYYFMEGDTPKNEPLPMNYFLLKPTDTELLAVDGINVPLKKCGANGQYCKTKNGWPSYIYYAQSVVNLGDDSGALKKALDNPASLWTLYNYYPKGKSCGLKEFVSGYTLETCRDLGHVGLAMSLTFSAAQTALAQGIDVYTPNADRFMKAIELYSQHSLGVSTLPLTLIGGGGGGFEMAYNFYRWVKNMKLPNQEQLISINRNAATAYGLLARQNYNGKPVECVYTAPPHGPLPGQLQSILLSGSNEFCGLQYATPDSQGNGPVRAFIASDYPVKVNASSTGAIPIDVSFNKPVTGLKLEGISVVNGTASNLKPVSCPNSNSMSCYTLDVTPIVINDSPNAIGGVAKTGILSVQVSADAAKFNGVGNVQSTELNFVNLFAPGTSAENIGQSATFTILTFGDLNMPR